MQTVLSHPLDVLTGRVFDANIFHPATGTLTYSDHLLLQSVLFSPVYALTHDAALVYNLVLLTSLVASALAMHLFVRTVLGTSGGAYVAGLAWGFGSYRFAHLLHIQLQALYFLPLTMLFLHRVVARRRLGDALVLGVLTGLQAIASVYYAVIGGIALLVGALVLGVTTGPTKVARLATRLALAAIVAGVLVLPVGIVYWRVQQQEGFGRNLYEASHSEAFADSYLQVPPGNLLYGRTGLLRHVDVEHTGVERELFPGFVVIALALAGAWFGWRSDRRPIVVSMCLLAIAGFVLSLGPEGVRPLYAVLYRYVFGFQAIRATARFAVLVTFALATLAAVGWGELAARWRDRGRARIAGAAILAAVAFECAHVPTMLAPAPPLRTDVGQWLAHAPGTGAVAILPLGIDLDNTPAMVQSLEHRRPIINGYSGQRPSFFSKLVDTLSTFPSPEALLALHDTGVQYVVTQSLDAAAEQASGALVRRARFGGKSIYEIVWTPAIEDRFKTLTTVVPPPAGPIPFSIGEQARYAATWDGAGVDLVAGEVTVSVEGPEYRLVATATTAPWVRRFFEAKDRFSTTTDATLLPLVHEREQQEGSRHVTRAYVYDAAHGRVRSGQTIDEARGEGAVTFPLPEGSRDAIAALFYARTLTLDPGTAAQFPVNEAGRNLVIELRARGKESVLVGGRQLDAIRLEPQLRQRVERRQPVRGTIWLSDDARRVPVKVELQAPFGAIKLELIEYRPGGPS
jgi:hypothetical protein